MSEFEARGVTVVMVSVDPPEVTLPWATKKGFTFALAGDPALEVIRGWHIENEEVGDLSFHAVFVVDTDGKIFYRKVGRRRALSDELLDAVDYHYGQGNWASADN
jgi:peroxiredoxin